MNWLHNTFLEIINNIRLAIEDSETLSSALTQLNELKEQNVQCTEWADNFLYEYESR